ncbi:MAG: ATP-binding cassette domain-containing protein, partial [Candidatus Competibacteraceae bacterium]|nr:ATP-binding cassette domain-containing protein [Candidatus Competibacteraceae bacterium]
MDRSIYREAYRVLGLGKQSDMTDLRGEMVIQRPKTRPRWLAAGTAINSVFDELGRTLLIAGAPGSGKTTLLLELTQALLEQAQQHIEQPIPVVFNLSSWSAQSLPFAAWLVSELTRHYRIPRSWAQSSLESGLILPLLDSLDEIGETGVDLEEQCIEAIAEFRHQHPQLPIAVCSRASGYDALAHQLCLQGTLIIQPLSRQTIARFLILMGEAPTAVHTALQQDAVLWELLRTPLMLGISALLCQQDKRSVLQLSGSLAARRDQLLDAYQRFRLGGANPELSHQIGAELVRLAAELQHRPFYYPSGTVLNRLSRRQRWLDYAVEQRLLLNVGNGYCFIHRLLQDYLASLASTADTQTVEPEPTTLNNTSIPPVLQAAGYQSQTAVIPEPTSLLTVRDLTVAFGPFSAVDRLNFTLQRGETLGVVGESGCGKSLTGLSLLRLTPPGATLTGEIDFDGHALLAMPETEMKTLRGRRIAMVFQEPVTALNPVYAVGAQVAEMFILHQHATRKTAWQQALAALQRVHIPDAARRARDYPHQLSGGMRQRVMIAMALACRPEVLIADEPTTALDVTVQAQILDLMLELQGQMGMAMLFISHDMGIISQVADRVLVMYAGKAMECASTRAVLKNPVHPYTRALLKTLPRLSERRGPLPTIAGTVPTLRDKTSGC